MRLKSLEVFGFKSFADRMHFEFEHGITGVVGPNGCGKSNVVDALRWVMGEQSAKSLRGGEMGDVIFGGSGRRKAMGYCEVVVSFENKDRRLPVDHDVVSIGRRLYRTGEGEYFINKELCRLRDIKEMIMDTGAGTASYCFIAQGQIDRLLTSDPKERRLVFEEAAGISKYRQRKAAAMRKLDRVEQNLQVLTSVRDEVDKRLRSVARQAQKARRYARYQDALKEKQVILALADYKELLAQRATLDTDLSALREKENAAQAKVDAEEAQVSKAESEQTELEERASEADERRLLAQAEAEKLEAAITHDEERAAELETNIAATREEIETLATQLEKRTAERARLEEEKKSIDSESAESSASYESVQQASKDAVHMERELSEKVEGCQSRAMEAVRARATAENELTASESDAKNAAGRAERLQIELDQLQKDYDESHTKADEAAARCTKLSDYMEKVESVSRNCQKKITELQGHVTRLDEMLSQKRAEIESRRARLAYLRELEDKSEGVSSGSREVMKAVKNDKVNFGKVMGLVAELVKAKPDVETAIETALGGRASDLVVDSSKTASTAIDFLRIGRLGRANFLPLDRMRKTLLLSPAHDEKKGVIGRACDLLEFDEALRPAVEYLLGRVLIVRDREDALRMAKDAGPGTRMVTLDGEIVDGNGPIMGGKSRSGNPGLLTRKTDIAKLVRIIKEADEMVRKLSANQSAVEEQRQEVLARAEKVAAGERELDGKLAEAKAELTSLRKEEKNLEARRFTVAAELDEASRDRDVFSQKAEELRARVDGLAETERSAREEAERLSSDVAKARAERESAEKKLTDLKVVVAGLEEKKGANESALEGVCRDITERTKTIDTRREEVNRMVTRVADSRKGAEEKRTQVEAKSGMLEKLATDASEARGRRDELRHQLETTRNANKASRSELLEAQKALNDFRVRENEIIVRIESLEERALNEFGVSLGDRIVAEEAAIAAKQAEAEEAVAVEAANAEAQAAAEDGPQTVAAEMTEAPTADAATENEQDAVADESSETAEGDSDEDAAEKTPEQSLEELRNEISDLRRKLESMGSVNMFALEEQKELESRSQFLNGQHNDLTKAQNSLKDVIGKINRKSRDLFQETFDDVRERFKDLFRKLFGGGRADVFLEEGMDILEAGIEVIAQPPGREALKLSLLSGGQKAMTTIALLFAIFGAKPSPFCVLDEVDAPLDDANVDRFNMILKEYTDTTQFIVITHNKATMGYASALYGVTMQEPGVSRKVSIRLEDIDENMNINPEAIEMEDTFKREGPFAGKKAA